MIIKSFARGLKSPMVAVMFERANPESLTEVMKWLSMYSERADTVSRLGKLAPCLKTKQEEQMDHVLQGQERLMTKLATFPVNGGRINNMAK